MFFIPDTVVYYQNKLFNLKITFKVDHYFYCFASLKNKQLLTEIQKFQESQEYAKYYYNNNQPVFGNEANMSENMTSHSSLDDGNFGWSSDELNGYFSS